MNTKEEKIVHDRQDLINKVIAAVAAITVAGVTYLLDLLSFIT